MHLSANGSKWRASQPVQPWLRLPALQLAQLPPPPESRSPTQHAGNTSQDGMHTRAHLLSPRKVLPTHTVMCLIKHARFWRAWLLAQPLQQLPALQLALLPPPPELCDLCLHDREWRFTCMAASLTRARVHLSEARASISETH
jgi:hypothetical protein